MGDGGAGRYGGVASHFDRCHQVGVAAHGGSLADRGAVLLVPVVVHRDGPAAEAGAGLSADVVAGVAVYDRIALREAMRCKIQIAIFATVLAVFPLLAFSVLSRLFPLLTLSLAVFAVLTVLTAFPIVALPLSVFSIFPVFPALSFAFELAFGGPELDTLYITTMGEGGTPGRDGGLFAWKPGFTGLPEPLLT